MIKLTEDDKNHFLSGDIGWFGSLEQRKEFWRQILDDYEKARKWDLLDLEENQEDQKLRGLIEKRIWIIKNEKDDFSKQSQDWNGIILGHLETLLEESKK